MSDVDDSLLMKHRAEVPAITELDQRKVSQKIRPRRYRADIDGLRAVAIVPVVLYHGGIAGFSGGFVGVDVFFVISGFLITSFILTEMDRGGFSLRSFYLRRIRRIFPALFLIVAFCSAIGWFLLTPNDYRRLGESIFAATFFSSNVLFWLEFGVFRHPDSAAPSTAHVVSRHRGAILHCLSDLPHAALPIISIEIGRHYCGAVRPLIWTKYSPAEKRSKRGFLSCPAANLGIADRSLAGYGSDSDAAHKGNKRVGCSERARIDRSRCFRLFK